MSHFNKENYSQLVQILQERIKAGDQQAENAYRMLCYDLDQCVDVWQTIISTEVGLMLSLSDIRRSKLMDKRITALCMGMAAVTAINGICENYGVDDIYIGDVVDREAVSEFCREFCIAKFNDGIDDK